MTEREAGKYWQCPKCTAIMPKPDRRRDRPTMSWRVRCGNCSRLFGAGDVISGMYDVSSGSGSDEKY